MGQSALSLDDLDGAEEIGLDALEGANAVDDGLQLDDLEGATVLSGPDIPEKVSEQNTLSPGYPTMDSFNVSMENLNKLANVLGVPINTITGVIGAMDSTPEEMERVIKEPVRALVEDDFGAPKNISRISDLVTSESDRLKIAPEFQKFADPYVGEAVQFLGEGIVDPLNLVGPVRAAARAIPMIARNGTMAMTESAIKKSLSLFGGVDPHIMDAYMKNVHKIDLSQDAGEIAIRVKAGMKHLEKNVIDGSALALNKLNPKRIVSIVPTIDEIDHQIIRLERNINKDSQRAIRTLTELRDNIQSRTALDGGTFFDNFNPDASELFDPDASGFQVPVGDLKRWIIDISNEIDWTQTVGKNPKTNHIINDARKKIRRSMDSLLKDKHTPEGIQYKNDMMNVQKDRAALAKMGQFFGTRDDDINNIILKLKGMRNLPGQRRVRFRVDEDHALKNFDERLVHLDPDYFEQMDGIKFFDENQNNAIKEKFLVSSTNGSRRTTPFTAVFSGLGGSVGGVTGGVIGGAFGQPAAGAWLGAKIGATPLGVAGFMLGSYLDTNGPEATMKVLRAWVRRETRIAKNDGTFTSKLLMLPGVQRRMFEEMTNEQSELITENQMSIDDPAVIREISTAIALNTDMKSSKRAKMLNELRNENSFTFTFGQPSEKNSKISGKELKKIDANEFSKMLQGGES